MMMLMMLMLMLIAYDCPRNEKPSPSQWEHLPINLHKYGVDLHEEVRRMAMSLQLGLR